MPDVVFTYFPAKGRGEAHRMLLAYGGVDFEDRRVPIDQWPAYKPKTPFGQMPVLEMNGKVYTQCIPMARYLGRKFGLVGSDLEEDFEIDQNVEFLNDIRARAAQVLYEPNEEIKNKRHEDFSKNHYPGLLDKLGEIVTKNNGHIACGKLTWGDFMFAGMFDYLKMMLRMPDLEKKYPSFKKLIDNVESQPKVKEWIAKSPKTDF